MARGLGKDIDRHFEISGDRLSITINTTTRNGVKDEMNRDGYVMDCRSLVFGAGVTAVARSQEFVRVHRQLLGKLRRHLACVFLRTNS
jgi:hypothetical protein